ncbi:MAG: CPBP family intramembrane metalloprotease [Chitinophagaceae bacterium]|nr:CPBP family intramembrane metalloprotease [Chitinophagaceae bacterium]
MAILFGAYHLANGWTLQNAFLGAGVWGIIFGLAAYRSGGIALPTGLHYAVNMTTSAFGISSGSYHLWVLKSGDGQSLANYQEQSAGNTVAADCVVGCWGGGDGVVYQEETG